MNQRIVSICDHLRSVMERWEPGFGELISVELPAGLSEADTAETITRFYDWWSGYGSSFRGARPFFLGHGNSLRVLGRRELTDAGYERLPKFASDGIDDRDPYVNAFVTQRDGMPVIFRWMPQIGHLIAVTLRTEYPEKNLLGMLRYQKEWWSAYKQYFNGARMALFANGSTPQTSEANMRIVGSRKLLLTEVAPVP